MIIATLLMLADAVSGAPAQVAPVASVAPAADPVHCVREEVTGSIAKKRKVCHTEREWNEIRSDAEKEARRIAVPSSPNINN